MTIGLCGESGVGKSTLLNCLNNQPNIKPSTQNLQEKCCFQGMHIKDNCQFLFYSMPNILSLKYISFIIIIIRNIQSPKQPITSFSHLLTNQLDALIFVPNLFPFIIHIGPGCIQTSHLNTP